MNLRQSKIKFVPKGDLMFKKIFGPLFIRILRPFIYKGLLHRYRIVKALSDFLLPRIVPDFVDVQGHKMYIDSRDSLRLSFIKDYENIETETFKKNIKKGDVVLDLGANIGYYTLIGAKIVRNEGKVFAFEPSPGNFKILKKNIEANGYKNVVAVQKAVSDKNGKIKLFLDRYSDASNSIYDVHDGKESVIVDSITLDDFLKNSGRIDFIKMDIEGAEGKALAGMSEILKRNKNLKIITEFNPVLLKGAGTDPKKYVELLQKNGFKIYDTKDNLKPVSPEKLIRRYDGNKLTNLLCTR